MFGAPSLLSPLSPHSSDRGRGWSKLCAINHVWHQHQGLQPWPWHCQMSVDTGGQTAAAVTAVNSSQQSFRHCSNPLSQVTVTWAQLSSPGKRHENISHPEWGSEDNKIQSVCCLFCDIKMCKIYWNWYLSIFECKIFLQTRERRVETEQKNVEKSQLRAWWGLEKHFKMREKREN